MYQESYFSGKFKKLSTNEIFRAVGESTLINELIAWIEQGNQTEKLRYFPEEAFEIKLMGEVSLTRDRVFYGQEFYYKYISYFRLKKYENIIPESQYLQIMTSLKNMFISIFSGDWQEAKIQLEQNNNFLNLDDYNIMHSEISNYISTYYNQWQIYSQNTEEFSGEISVFRSKQ